jgi:hypothetical protein
VIQIDGFGNISTKFEYDAQGRLVRSSSGGYESTWTYDAARATVMDSFGHSYVYELGADGQAVHYEGPEEAAAADRRAIDYHYDTAGNLVSIDDYVPASQSHPATPHTDHDEWTYDDQDRVASSKADYNTVATTFTYTETPGHLTIELSGETFDTWTYDFDDAGRVIAAKLDNGFDFRRGYSYSYADETITATPTEIPAGNHESVMTATGLCPGIASTFGPEKPYPLDLLHGSAHAALWLANPPVEAFGPTGI